jgi:hypothetical protein
VDNTKNDRVIWLDHLKQCKQCAIACRTRFCQVENANEITYNKCCDTGKILYKSFIDYCNTIEN